MMADARNRRTFGTPVTDAELAQMGEWAPPIQLPAGDLAAASRPLVQKGRRLVWLLPEYCPGPFFWGWWIYRRDVTTPFTPVPGFEGWGWLRNELHLEPIVHMLNELGHEMPSCYATSTPTGYGATHYFTERFVAKFPVGILASYSYEYGSKYEPVAMLPDRSMAAALCTRNARAFLAVVHRWARGEEHVDAPWCYIEKAAEALRLWSLAKLIRRCPSFPLPVGVELTTLPPVPPFQRAPRQRRHRSRAWRFAGSR